jgi:hypothetical protein
VCLGVCGAAGLRDAPAGREGGVGPMTSLGDVILDRSLGGVGGKGF